MKQPDCIGAAADTGDERVRQSAGRFQTLLPGFPADYRLQVPDQYRIWMRPGHGADNIERIVHVAYPVPHGFIHGILESLRTGSDFFNHGSQQFHPEYVHGLAPYIFGAHIDDTLEAKPGGNRGSGHAVLACAGFSNDAGFPHPLRQQGLAHRVIDLMGAGMIQVLALQVDLGAGQLAAPPVRVIQGRRPAHESFKVTVELCQEVLILNVLLIGAGQLVQGFNQGLSDKPAPVHAEMAL